MESFLSRFKNPLVLIALLLVQAVALATQVRRAYDPEHPDAQGARLIRLWAGSLLTPFERASTFAGRGVRGAWGDYVDLRHVRQENADLQRQMAALKLERAAISEDAVEAHRLRALMDFRQHYITQTVAAQVIGGSGTDQSRLLLIDKGYHDGLKAGMPVVTPDGVVGKLRDVFADSAQLLLLNDASSGAGVLLETTRIRAIVKGSAPGALVITNLTPNEQIKPGERVLTSGGDMVFPRGIAVGTIESIKPDPEHQPYTLITLKPAANLFQLEDVLVVTGTGGSLGPQTEEELARDAQIHAADVSAERLPSMNDKAAGKPDAADGSAADPNGPADAPPPDNSTQLVPKPRAVVHPDRFSPGTIAPAEDLTPGAGKPK